MEGLIISLVIYWIILKLMKQYFPGPYGAMKKLFISGLKGWSQILRRTQKKTGGAKTTPPRMRYRR